MAQRLSWRLRQSSQTCRRDPGGAPGRRGDRRPSRRRDLPLRPPRADHLVGRTGLDPVPVARDAGLGGGVPAGEHMRMTAIVGMLPPGRQGIPRRRWRSRRRSPSCCWSFTRPTSSRPTKSSSRLRRWKFPTPGGPRRCRSASADDADRRGPAAGQRRPTGKHVVGALSLPWRALVALLALLAPCCSRSAISTC